MLTTVLFRLLAVLLAAGASSGDSSGASAPSIPTEDRSRLAEAFRLAEAIGDAIWPGWSKVPFAVVLVTPETEFFVRHGAPPSDAKGIGWDALLRSDVSARPRTFPVKLLATFPIEGVSTVVVGQRENTSTTSATDWVVTLLHEHFHQLQETQPGYYGKVSALGLARGDATGLWMLNFPFPYEAPAVGNAYRDAAQALRVALGGGDAGPFLAARRRFRETVSGDDLKYLDFQLWKEGIARYTQIQVARFAGSERYTPSPAFAALSDFVSYSTLANDLSETLRDELSKRTLAEDRRTVVYPFGGGEGLLLDRLHPCWRDQYFSNMFTLAKAFEEDCGKRAATRQENVKMSPCKAFRTRTPRTTGASVAVPPTRRAFASRASSRAIRSSPSGGRSRTTSLSKEC
jgi:hypothetical protein